MFKRSKTVSGKIDIKKRAMTPYDGNYHSVERQYNDVTLT